MPHRASVCPAARPWCGPPPAQRPGSRAHRPPSPRSRADSPTAGAGTATRPPPGFAGARRRRRAAAGPSSRNRSPANRAPPRCAPPAQPEPVRGARGQGWRARTPRRSRRRRPRTRCVLRRRRSRSVSRAGECSLETPARAGREPSNLCPRPHGLGNLRRPVLWWYCPCPDFTRALKASPISFWARLRESQLAHGAALGIGAFPALRSGLPANVLGRIWFASAS